MKNSSHSFCHSRNIASSLGWGLEKIELQIVELEEGSWNNKITEYIFRGLPKMVGFPNKPMGFPTKNDHFGVWNGGTPIYGNTHLSDWSRVIFPLLCLFTGRICLEIWNRRFVHAVSPEPKKHPGATVVFPVLWQRGLQYRSGNGVMVGMPWHHWESNHQQG